MNDILERIDSVLKDNQRTERLYIALTSVLFLSGIGCLISAIVTKEYGWSIPSVITTGLLHYPLQAIRSIREKNIALATVPLLINQLPKAKAAEEIQKLIQHLHGNS